MTFRFFDFRFQDLHADYQGISVDVLVILRIEKYRKIVVRRVACEIWQLLLLGIAAVAADIVLGVHSFFLHMHSRSFCLFRFKRSQHAESSTKPTKRTLFSPEHLHIAFNKCISHVLLPNSRIWALIFIRVSSRKRFGFCINYACYSACALIVFCCSRLFCWLI